MLKNLVESCQKDNTAERPLVNIDFSSAKTKLYLFTDLIRRLTSIFLIYTNVLYMKWNVFVDIVS